MQQTGDAGDELPRLDRLGEVHLVAGQEGSLPVFGPGVRRHGNGRNRALRAGIERRTRRMSS